MRSPGWVLGFHGCDREIGESVLRGETVLRPSRNTWDWLGEGIYFWENDTARAKLWARSTGRRSPLSKEPFVLGAILNLGNCLDMLEAESIRYVRESYEELALMFSATGNALPSNAGAEPDRVVRRLDCAVINYVHELRAERKQLAFHSVRAAFMEGGPLYEGAGFHARTHIQLCVRSDAQIIGYFRVRDDRS